MAHVVRYPAKGEVHNPEPNKTTNLVCPPGLQSFNRLPSLNIKPCVSYCRSHPWCHGVVCVALTVFLFFFFNLQQHSFYSYKDSWKSTKYIYIWAILLPQRAVNYLKLLWAAVLATNLNYSALFLELSATAQIYLISSGILGVQVRIPIKQAGSSCCVFTLR